MLINQANLDFLFQQWDQRFEAAYETQPNYWDTYADEMPSDTDLTVHSWLARQTGLRKWVGARHVDNVVARGYTLRNEDYEKTIGLDRNKILDDTYGVFGKAVDSLGAQSKMWPDDVMTPVVEAGTTELCLDGQFFFDTDHPVDIDDASKGTYSNSLIGAQYDMSLDPKGAYKLGRAAMAKFKDESGRPLGIVPNVLMVPPDLEEAAMIVANANLIAQTTKNVAGTENVASAAVSNVWQGAIKPFVNTRLTNQAAAYLLCTVRAVKPFIWQLRQAPQLVARTSPTDPSVFDSKLFLYGVDGRGAGGYAFPWLALRLAPS